MEELKKAEFPLLKKRTFRDLLTNKSILLDYLYLALHFIFTLSILTNITPQIQLLLYTLIITLSGVVLVRFRISRWQNVFLYLNTLLYPFLPTTLYSHLLILIFFVLSALLLLIFPIPFLLPLSGPFGVGTKVGWVRVGAGDDEHLSFLHNYQQHLPADIKAEGREISMQIWYPMEREEYEGAPRIPFWWPAAPHVFPHLLRIFQMPLLLIYHLLLGKSNAVEGGKISSKYEKYPMVFASHGFYGFKNVCSFQWEQLASWGVIVVGIDHIGDCSLAVSHTRRLSIPFFSYLTPEDNEREIRHRGLIFRSSDLFYLLNLIHSLNPTPSFPTPSISQTTHCEAMEMIRGRVEIERVGCIGHSYGGATGIYMALGNDERIRCVVCLDPWAWPLLPSPSLYSPSLTSLPSVPPFHRSPSLPSIIAPLSSEIERQIVEENEKEGKRGPPMLFINSEVWRSAPFQKDIRQMIIERMSGEGSKSIILKGTDHHNFDDLPFFASASILRMLGNFIGPINPLDAFDVMTFLSIRFFAIHFSPSSQPLSLLSSCRQYIEIEKEYK